MAAADLWGQLAGCAAAPFAPGWPNDDYAFFAPRDNLHQAILAVVQSAAHSVLANHYGFDDPEIADALYTKATDPEIAFLLNLDSTQAGGAHERQLLEQWQSLIGTSVAVGQSVKHAISHLKITVVDGIYTISGSTNLSLAGEQRQDNELRVSRNPLLAARYSSVILVNHTTMIAQMRAKQSR